MFVSTTKKDFDVVTERLRDASEKLRSAIRQTLVFDACLIVLWSCTAVAPILGSDALHTFSAFVLCVLCTLVPLAATLLRISTGLILCRQSTMVLRVDMIANSPSKMRQMAYTSHYPPLGTWFRSGYAGAAGCIVWNCFVLFVWSLVFGLDWSFGSLIAFETALTVYLLVSNTSWLYQHGIQENFSLNVEPGRDQANEWGRMRATEHGCMFLQKK